MEPGKDVKLLWEREITFEVPPERLQEAINTITHQETTVTSALSSPTPSAPQSQISTPRHQHPSTPPIHILPRPVEEPIAAVEVHPSPHHRGGLKPEHRFHFAHGGAGSSVEGVTTPGRDTELTLPLLGNRTERTPVVISASGFEETRPPGFGDDQENNNYFTSVALLTSSILGVGLFALPKFFALMGVIGGTIALLLVAFLFSLSFGVLSHSARATGESTYSGIVRQLLGPIPATILDIAQMFFTFGALVLVLIVLSDIIVGDGKNGLLEGWEQDRGIVLSVLALIILAPVSSFKELRYFSSTSLLGVIAALLWAVLTIVLLISAVLHGTTEKVQLFPKYSDLGNGWFTSLVQLLAIPTVLFIAASAHTNFHQVAKNVRPQRASRVSKVGTSSLIYGFGMYLIIGIACYVLFGSDVKPDVLKSFTVKAMKPLIGCFLAKSAFLGVRLAYIVSLVATFPLLMCSFRDAVWRQLFWSELIGPGVAIVSYVMTGVVLAVAVRLHSIWEPLQLVGAVGGTLVAFIFPGLIAIRLQADAGAIVGILLLTLGVVLFLCGGLGWFFLPSLGD